jgi:pimeloyl-ACP methyl ester carboxylesterase
MMPSEQNGAIAAPGGRRPRVVLVHGLCMGRPVMQVLAKRLRSEGFEVGCFGYNTLTGPLATSAGRLATFVQRDARPVVLVGHSLGGLVSVQAAQSLEAGKLAGVVLLGSPYQGAQAARVLHGAAGGALSGLGRALSDWSALPEKPTVPVPVFTLAGTRSAGLGQVLCRFGEPNDGTVSVAETHYPGATACMLPVGHTDMLFDRQVAAQLVAWLRTLPPQ